MPRPEIVIPSAVNRKESYPKTASVPLARGDFTTFVAGYLKRNTSAEPKVLGLWRDRDVTSSSADYAQNSMGTVEVDEMGIYEIDPSTTVVQATHVGNAYDLSNHTTLNLGASSNDTFIVVGGTPDGRARCKLNRYFGDGTA